MSKWLNGRIRGQSAIGHELFPTEDAAITALGKALYLHRQHGHRVVDVWDGPKLRHEIHDEMVAVHWLSDTSDSPGPLSHES
jgi:hypothetical protein